ncbi:MAG TPA: argininosuccinate lyase [Candidatus Baltobacteraceae bacterium]|nr:argininosuccinate lyase [Candidatus Baltobacteraceae bacterium]
MHGELQWGGRFTAPPDASLLAFGSSLEEDLVLAPFDVAGSRAHVQALLGGGLIDATRAKALESALDAVASEIEAGSFAAWARARNAEDVHGAIDARVRELAPGPGHDLHTGRSRNDQVATALTLYARERAERARDLCLDLARDALARARDALREETVLPATTHWQPAQPILLAFWLEAVAESFARAARRCARVADDARLACPLGSGACSGSTLPLDRTASARSLEFSEPARNALDAIGDRDLALDLLHALARALLAASRVSGELVVWTTPAFGFARLGDAASTGSSLMPQKRNPDPFELVRGTAALLNGELLGALGSLCGLPLSYHRDLQATKAAVIRGTERALAALDAFQRAFALVEWNATAMRARAADGYTVATDVADALIARGVQARTAHALVGQTVAAAERAQRPLEFGDLAALGSAAGLEGSFSAPLDPLASVRAKRTAGSTHPAEVARAIAELEEVLEREFGKGSP